MSTNIKNKTVGISTNVSLESTASGEGLANLEKNVAKSPVEKNYNMHLLKKSQQDPKTINPFKSNSKIGRSPTKSTSLADLSTITPDTKMSIHQRSIINLISNDAIQTTSHKRRKTHSEGNLVETRYEQRDHSEYEIKIKIFGR